MAGMGKILLLPIITLFFLETMIIPKTETNLPEKRNEG